LNELKDKISETFPNNNPEIMSIAASICLVKKGIPPDAANLIIQFMCTRKWMSLLAGNGYVRKVCPVGFTEVDALFHFKLHAMRSAVSHPIVYNGLYVFQNARTYEQPWMTRHDQFLPEADEPESTLTRRFYTEVEVANNVFEYILHQIKYVRGEATQNNESIVYRPYTANQFGQAQLLVSQQMTNSQLSNIRFSDWYGGWIWTQEGIMDFAEAIPIEEPEEIDWADDDDAEEEIEWADDNIEPEVFEWAATADAEHEATKEWHEGRMETREDADGNLFWQIV
jgi:hypothetical protein